ILTPLFNLKQKTIGVVMPFVLILIPIFIIASAVLFAVKRYRRCPSNKILVIYGRVGKDKSAICIHGGGAFIWPLIQDSQYMHLEPITIDINLTGALSQQNIR